MDVDAVWITNCTQGNETITPTSLAVVGETRNMGTARKRE